MTKQYPYHPSHSLKIWPEFFNAISSGAKRFEVRKNDRDYALGDQIHFREFDPDKNDYTGRYISMARITYVMPGGEFGIDPDYVVLGIAV